MKKIFGFLALSLAFLGIISTVSADVTTDLVKGFSVQVSDVSTFPGWIPGSSRVGSNQIVRWTYPNGQSYAQAFKVTISLIDENGIDHLAGTFPGVRQSSGQGGILTRVIIHEHSIKVPDVTPGNYKIMVSVTANAIAGGGTVADISTGTVEVDPKSGSNGGGHQGKITARLTVTPAGTRHVGDKLSFKVTANTKDYFANISLKDSSGTVVSIIAQGAGDTVSDWTIPDTVKPATGYKISLDLIESLMVNGLATIGTTTLATYTTPAFRINAAAGSGNATTTSAVTITSCTADLTSPVYDPKTRTTPLVTWTAVADGLDSSVTYTYIWTGTGGLPGGKLTSPTQYKSAGRKTARIVIKQGSKIVASKNCDAITVIRSHTVTGSVFDAVSGFWDSLWN